MGTVWFQIYFVELETKKEKKRKKTILKEEGKKKEEHINIMLRFFLVTTVWRDQLLSGHWRTGTGWYGDLVVNNLKQDYAWNGRRKILHF